jgi:hypothetical protein
MIRWPSSRSSGTPAEEGALESAARVLVDAAVDAVGAVAVAVEADTERLAAGAGACAGLTAAAARARVESSPGSSNAITGEP